MTDDNDRRDSPDKYKRHLRQLCLDSLLKRINRESAAIMFGKRESAQLGFRWDHYSFIDPRNKKLYKQDVRITSWGLIDLAYDAIMTTNDYRGRDNIEDEEFASLVFEADKHKDEKTESKLKGFREKGEGETILHIWAIAGEQFKMQAPAMIFENVARELFILFELAKDIDNANNKSIPEAIQEEVGVEWENIVTTLFLLWFASTKSTEIAALERQVQWDKEFSLHDFRKVVKRYSTTYKEVKASSMGRQIFLKQPFVETSRGETISISCYLNLFLYEHCILWIARDYYYKTGDNSFPSRFGGYFEKYFEGLLGSYVETDNYERIPSGEHSSADWKLCIGGHTFLIEQKSALISLSVRRQDPNIRNLKEFIERHIEKAIQQLDCTEHSLDSGKCIKILLLYEDYLNPEFWRSILRTRKIKDDGFYWLVTINEMEMLLYQYKNAPSLFNSVVFEKMKREVEEAQGARSLKMILSEKGVMENQHLKQEKFLFYEYYAQYKSEKYLMN